MPGAVLNDSRKVSQSLHQCYECMCYVHVTENKPKPQPLYNISVITELVVEGIFVSRVHVLYHCGLLPLQLIL